MYILLVQCAVMSTQWPSTRLLNGGELTKCQKVCMWQVPTLYDNKTSQSRLKNTLCAVQLGNAVCWLAFFSLDTEWWRIRKAKAGRRHAFRLVWPRSENTTLQISVCVISSYEAFVYKEIYFSVMTIQRVRSLWEQGNWAAASRAQRHTWATQHQTACSTTASSVVW
jgi:hypothetical protein